MESDKFVPWQPFKAIPFELRGLPGVYEIRCGKTALLVGIAGNLVKRLKEDRKSLDRHLAGPDEKPWTDPALVTVTGSILAKHLYFDEAIAKPFKLDLKKQEDRLRFLEEHCEVRWQVHPTRDSARRVEIALEKSGKYRYAGDVRRR